MPSHLTTILIPNLDKLHARDWSSLMEKLHDQIIEQGGAIHYETDDGINFRNVSCFVVLHPSAEKQNALIAHIVNLKWPNLPACDFITGTLLMS